MLQQEVKRALRSGDTIGLLVIDADHFKQINDNHGHPVGDACLKMIAQTLQAGVQRECDTVARFGGEEFCVILPSTSAEGVGHVADALRRSIEAQVVRQAGEEIRLTVSIGAVAVAPSDPDDDLRMLATADAALYTAKEEGRNRVCLRDRLDP